MRILKRNLSFMLALVMMLGLVVTSNAATYKDYTDANDITYVEAVDYLTALGVFQGENGVFYPNRVLTREEGAKLMAYVVLGAKSAESLATTSAPFLDVAATRWSSKYVTFCANQGIIGGYGNGKFGPEDELTANQLAKMLLCAVGYGVKDEFVGPNWEIEANKTALVNDIFEGNLGADFTQGVTREEAALYIFNTLTKVMTVNYSETFGAYYTGPLFNSVTKFDNEYTLGFINYATKSKDTTDDFGRNAHYWVKNANTKITNTYADKADATYTAQVKSGKIYTDLGVTGSRMATVIVNGEEANDFQVKRSSTTNLPESGNGVLVEAFVDEDENVTIVIINEYLAKVTKVTSDEVTVEPYGLSGAASTLKFETAVEYEKDDLVIITYSKSAGEIQSMKAPETETGVAKIYADGYITLEGTKYNKSQFLKNNDTVGENSKVADFYKEDSESEMEILLDEYGYAMGIIIVEEADGDLAYVLVTDSEGKPGSLLNNKAAVVEVKFMDGTTDVLPLPIKKDGTVTKYKGVKANGEVDWIAVNNGKLTNDGSTNVDTNGINGFYRYSLNDDGEILLKALKTTGEDGMVNAVLKTNKQAVEAENFAKLTTSFVLNSKTVLTTVKDETVKTYTGYKNINLDIEATDKASVLVIYSGKVITEIYVVDYDNTSEATYVYYNGDTFKNSGDVWVTVYQDGVKKDYEFNTALAAITVDTTEASKGIWEIKVSGDEIVEAKLATTNAASFPALANAQLVTKTTEYGFETTGHTGTDGYVFADDVEIWDMTLSGDNKGTAGVVVTDQKITFVVKDNFVKVVYITNDGSSSVGNDNKPTSNNITLSVDGGKLNISVTGFATDAATPSVTVACFAYDQVSGEYNSEVFTAQTKELATGSGTATRSAVWEMPSQFTTPTSYKVVVTYGTGADAITQEVIGTLYYTAD